MNGKKDYINNRINQYSMKDNTNNISTNSASLTSFQIPVTDIVHSHPRIYPKSTMDGQHYESKKEENVNQQKTNYINNINISEGNINSTRKRMKPSCNKRSDHLKNDSSIETSKKTATKQKNKVKNNYRVKDSLTTVEDDIANNERSSRIPKDNDSNKEDTTGTTSNTIISGEEAQKLKRRAQIARAARKHRQRQKDELMLLREKVKELKEQVEILQSSEPAEHITEAGWKEEAKQQAGVRARVDRENEFLRHTLMEQLKFTQRLKGLFEAQPLLNAPPLENILANSADHQFTPNSSMSLMNTNCLDQINNSENNSYSFPSNVSPGHAIINTPNESASLPTLSSIVAASAKSQTNKS